MKALCSQRGARDKIKRKQNQQTHKEKRKNSLNKPVLSLSLLPAHLHSGFLPLLSPPARSFPDSQRGLRWSSRPLRGHVCSHQWPGLVFHFRNDLHQSRGQSSIESKAELPSQREKRSGPGYLPTLAPHQD